MISQNWNSTICELPGATFLQTTEWAQIKAPVGWSPRWDIWPATGENAHAAAMTLYRSISHMPVCVAYVPRGPLVDWSDPARYVPVLEDLVRQARERKAIFLKIDPDLVIGEGVPGTDSDYPNSTGLTAQNYLQGSGWSFSTDQIQFRNTIEIDISIPEEQLLKQMHPKTRYNIRLAEKKGVCVSTATEGDWPQIYRLYSETADRDGFVVRPWDYYQRVWATFSGSRMADCLKAEINGELIAAIWVVGFGKKAHYLYGMSSGKHREFMPNHLLQWRGIQLSRSQGRQIYDMWGAPNEFKPGDPLSGVFRFKQGFGGKVVRTLGAWDYPIQPLSYRFYTSVLPSVFKIMRSRGRSKTKRFLEG